LWSIRSALIQQGHQVSWIVRRNQPLHRRVDEAGDDIVSTPLRRGVNPREWLAVVRGLRWHAPDVLILNDSHAIMLGGSAALAARPVRPWRLAFRHVTFPIRSPLKLRWMADSIVCVSEAARQSVLDAGLAQERTVVIYGGCEPTNFDPSARQWAERELGLSPSAPLLVCVGNLLECKGHVPLIEAAARMRQQIPDAHMAIAGEGVLRQSMETRIAELNLSDRVHLLGFRTDADRWLSAASVVLHPSLQEGLSLVLIQAQMLRKLIVSTGVGGSAEVLGLNEAVPCPVWLAKPDDPESLAEQMRLAVQAWRSTDPSTRADLDRAALRAGQKFDIASNVATLVDHIRHKLPQT
ncbi:MAG: glycosyltransferase, partial [Pirellulaceae bacterium]|nr:glycosyltransferase [Pirellulaceae bacterium]